LLPEHLFCAVPKGEWDLIGAIAIAQHRLKAFEMLNKGQDWSKDPKASFGMEQNLRSKDDE